MFRHIKINQPIPKIGKVMETVVETEVKDGIEYYTLVKKDASINKIPRPSDYRLSVLLAAGVPLKEVNPVIDERLNESDVDFLTDVNNAKTE